MGRTTYKMWKGIALLALNLAASPAVAEIDPVSIIVPQPDAPVRIVSYKPVYVARGGAYVTEGIHHSVEYLNATDRPITAIQIGLVSFDIWNEFLDKTGGISTEPMKAGASGKGTWVASRYAGFSFLTGVAYVDRVRFDDGTIWKANTETIASEMRKFEKDFDVKDLKEKKTPGGGQ